MFLQTTKFGNMDLGDTRLRLPSDCNHLEAYSQKKERCIAKNKIIMKVLF